MTITKDTIIGDILNIAPETAPLFMNIGMHCLGCPASRGETVEQACMVHGVDVDELLAAVTAYQDDLLPHFEPQVHTEGFPPLVGVRMVHRLGGAAAGVGVRYRMPVADDFGYVVHGHLHRVVPDGVGEDKLLLPKYQLLVRGDLQRREARYGPVAYAHRIFRPDGFNRRFLDCPHQSIQVK